MEPGAKPKEHCTNRGALAISSNYHHLELEQLPGIPSWTGPPPHGKLQQIQMPLNIWSRIELRVPLV
jgi:hypothetical protein